MKNKQEKEIIINSGDSNSGFLSNKLITDNNLSSQIINSQTGEKLKIGLSNQITQAQTFIENVEMKKNLVIDGELTVHGTIHCIGDTDCQGSGGGISGGGNDDPDPLGDGSGDHLYRLNGNMDDEAATWNGGLTGGRWDDNGKFGKCLAIEDDSSYAQIYDLSPFYKNKTISMWVYIPSDGNITGLYLSNHFQVKDNGILNLPRQHLSNMCSAGNYVCYNDLKYPFTFPFNTWFNFTFVMENENLAMNGNCMNSGIAGEVYYLVTYAKYSLYINGSYIDCGNTSTECCNGSLKQSTSGTCAGHDSGYSQISGYLGYGPVGFRGKIDHVRIFNRALTQSEVTNIIQIDSNY